jgi:hypothetical protein
MKLSRNSLMFRPVEKELEMPEQNIKLTRTQIYKLESGGRFFIVFKEKVDKMVNIVEAGSLKIMDTIFLKLQDYINSISTSFQW